MLFRVFLIGGYLGLLGFTSYAQDPASQKVSSTVKSRHVNISDDKGNPFGCLRESEDGETLLFVKPDGEIIPCGSWGDRIKQKTPSPGSPLMAVVYVRNCGASTDFATRVDLVSSEKDAGKNDPNMVFVMKGDQALSLEWKGPQKLIIRYPRSEKDFVYRQQTQLGDIVIEYSEMTKLADETQYIEISNFDFGLTGVVVWHNEEVLLRMAGWAQEKSGLIKQEWNCWYGRPPYGDDPSEQNYMKQGFEYYRLNRDEIEKDEK